MASDRDTLTEAESQRFKRQRHTWECMNTTRIGSWEHDACNCPENNNPAEETP